MKPSALFVVAALIAVSFSCTAFGQVKYDEPVKTVRIYGRVTDVTGAIVPSVAVALKVAKSSRDGRKRLAVSFIVMFLLRSWHRRDRLITPRIRYPANVSPPLMLKICPVT